jgi:hypothetical protein
MEQHESVPISQERHDAERLELLLLVETLQQELQPYVFQWVGSGYSTVILRRRLPIFDVVDARVLKVPNTPRKLRIVAYIDWQKSRALTNVVYNTKAEHYQFGITMNGQIIMAKPFSGTAVRCDVTSLSNYWLYQLAKFLDELRIYMAESDLLS